MEDESEIVRLEALCDAIAERERLYAEGIDRLREIASDESRNEVYDIACLLREAIELTRCLRRLVPDRTVSEIHRAFGAPGDFGYETQIGAALARVYRVGVKRPSVTSHEADSASKPGGIDE